MGTTPSSPAKQDDYLGLEQLTELVAKLKQGPAPVRDENFKKPPIVLVSGFSGWDGALFGTFNYWGGFKNLAEVLNEEGYPVIVVRIGGLSSNWERACEVYAQLTQRKFEAPDAKSSTTTIPINYGNHWPPEVRVVTTKQDKPAIAIGLGDDWKWDADHPVHFICHSQGGNTIRLLAKLMENGADEHPEYFEKKSRDTWIKSIITLGTPHKGTTIINVLKDLAPVDWKTLLAQVIVSASYLPPTERFYDLHLDHWGFARRIGEDFQQMLDRLKVAIGDWASSEYSGFWDNSIVGVSKVNEKYSVVPAKNIYYFTMSFTATVPFPKIDLTPDDIRSFPLRNPLKPDETIPLNSHGLFGGIGAVSAAIFNVGFDVAVDESKFANWVTGVAGNHLKGLGYPISLPNPGSQVPRPDMLPLMAPTAYAMGGYKLADPELSKLKDMFNRGPVTDVDFQKNDGIVNTRSMSGPDEKFVKYEFPQDLQQNIKQMKGNWYWSMGPNGTMDHADEIGVFTDENTSQKVVKMYQVFAELLDYLP